MSLIIIHVGCSVSICDEADALSTFQKFLHKNRLPSLVSYVSIQLGKVGIHNYLVNAMSLSLSYFKFLFFPHGRQSN